MQVIMKYLLHNDDEEEGIMYESLEEEGKKEKQRML